jgi:repressor LexA
MPRTTNTRQVILDFIREYRLRHDYAPTLREIGEHCGIKSTSNVEFHLSRLEREGLIARERDKSRSISLTGRPPGLVVVPVLGVIAAGHPIWVPSADMRGGEADRVIEVSREITRDKTNIFALQVRGNSMVDALIADEDVVIIEGAADIRNGDVAACWLKNEEEVTLKKVYFEEGRVRLQPCNPYMMPVYHDAANVEFQGRVIAVIRTSR